jgi:hypothetical protein
MEFVIMRLTNPIHERVDTFDTDALVGVDIS